MQPLNHSTASRINSVDFIRGLVMVLMAIDHVRVYSGQPAGTMTLLVDNVYFYKQ